MTPCQHIAIIGAGTMGAGLAQIAAQAGCRVSLVDLSYDALSNALDGIRQRLDRLADKGRINTRERDAACGLITPVQHMEELPPVELAIEAVVEKLSVKQELFQRLESILPDDSILATNTSSLSVTKIGHHLHDPSRLIGMHFFNPVPLMPLVEIIATAASRESFLDRAMATARAWGKTPVRVSDTPGFIVNRVARGYYLEALRLLEHNTAPVEQIDAVMKTLGGFRMGPFELMDLVGLDVNYTVSCSVFEQMGNPARLAPSDIQRRLVDQGRMGRKTNIGVYSYRVEPPKAEYDITPVPFEPSDALAATLHKFSERAALPGTTERATHLDRYIFARILAAILNETGFALEDNIASGEDIDTAMKLGTNYPRGPVEWANAIGYPLIVQTLEAMATSVGDTRYLPAPIFSA